MFIEKAFWPTLRLALMLFLVTIGIGLTSTPMDACLICRVVNLGTPEEEVSCAETSKGGTVCTIWIENGLANCEVTGPACWIIT